MRRLILTFACFSFFFSLFCQSRSSSENKVKELYNKAKNQAQLGDRDKAINFLRQALTIDSLYYMAYFALSDIYHQTGEVKFEREALINGLRTGGDYYPLGYKFLSTLLYLNGEYDDALSNIEHYSTLKRDLTVDEKQFMASCRFAYNALKSPVPFQSENAGNAINTNEDEYWPSLNGEANELVFTRLLTRDKQGQKLAYSQEDFFISVKDPNGWNKAVPVGPPINTQENEGAQCISADGHLLFFTGCNRTDGLGSCDIYLSVKLNGKWTVPVNLGSSVNSGAWESQPSVSADGQLLYFVSNRSGGKGKMDIWRAERLGVSPRGIPVYGKVTNLERVNTKGDEVSPFIFADGKTLYFASDYWPGMGGKDLFFIPLDSIDNKVPVNLGYPINTSGDEEGLVVEVSGKRAWYTANSKGFGGRDIFTFSLPEQYRPQAVSWVKGRIINPQTGHLMPSDIILNDLVANRVVQHLYPFENDGEFLFCLPSGHNYGLSINKKGYLFHSENFNFIGVNSRQHPLILDIPMDSIAIGNATTLNNIFFETDSFRIKPESVNQLKEIVVFMNLNPGLIIEIGGHTDNQGTKLHNQILSAKRAEEVVSVLTEMGIAKNRLNSKGYDYSEPVADNGSEQGRAKNRRIEFKIMDNR